MEDHYSREWIEAQVAQTVEVWKSCAARPLPALPRCSLKEQRSREKACDQGLKAVEREARQKPRGPIERQAAQRRMEELFPRFAAAALGLDAETVDLLAKGFLPIGRQFSRWARAYDSALSMNDTVQACRNAWIACGMQSLLGQPMELTPSIIAYSMLYPYSDNYLDDPQISSTEKRGFNERFRRRLCGQRLPASGPREASVWAMVEMIEGQYPRPSCPRVYEGLLAIHEGQQQSLAQLRRGDERALGGDEVLRISCAKGGSSVLADACLVEPQLTHEESGFSFAWGVLLQLGDDLQDLGEDLERGSQTLFTRAAAEGQPLDGLVTQLLNFSEQVAGRMDRLEKGSGPLKELMRTSWRLLILMAVADAPAYFTPGFLAELEPCSSFRFGFLRARKEKLAGRKALYPFLYEAFLDGAESDQEFELSGLPVRLSTVHCSLSTAWM